MSLTSIQGLTAYARAAGRAIESLPSPQIVTPSDEGGFDFKSMVSGMIDRSGAAMRAAEEVSARAVLGKASVVELVTAVSTAETELQTLIAVRDRMVSAYQDIMRMSI